MTWKLSDEFIQARAVLSAGEKDTDRGTAVGSAEEKQQGKQSPWYKKFVPLPNFPGLYLDLLQENRV
jgi:hypothetical protein